MPRNVVGRAAAWSVLAALTHANEGPNAGRLVLNSAGGLPNPWVAHPYNPTVGSLIIFDSRMPILGNPHSKTYATPNP